MGRMHAAPPRPRRPARAVVRAVAVALLVGERPPDAPPRPRRPRAPRAMLASVRVDPAGVSWRSVLGRRGHLSSTDLAAVALVDCAHVFGQPTNVHRYALLLDQDGGVRLRVRADDPALRRAGDLLGVPVRRATTTNGTAKDYRRRWPEAFSWVHAHRFVAWTGATAAYLAVGWLVERLTA